MEIDDTDSFFLEGEKEVSERDCQSFERPEDKLSSFTNISSPPATHLWIGWNTIPPCEKLAQIAAQHRIVRSNAAGDYLDYLGPISTLAIKAIDPLATVIEPSLIKCGQAVSQQGFLVPLVAILATGLTAERSIALESH